MIDSTTDSGPLGRTGAWRAATDKAIREMGRWPKRTVQVVHHNDADGLCSAAILTRAFEREGYEVKRLCLEKPYPPVLERLYEQEGEIFVFADLAGRIAPLISELNRGRNLTLILDHHVAKEATDPRVHNLDPDLFGIKGDRDISASTTCFLFAQNLDPVNRDLAHIAVLGAVGDGFLVDGKLAGENRDVALEAVQRGLVGILEQSGGERYLLRSSTGEIPGDELARYLDTLGGAGYHRKGPEMGVRVCLEGVSLESDRMVDELKITKSRLFEAEIARIYSQGLNRSRNIQWLHVENRFAPMGVKMIGAFCDAIKDLASVDPTRYIAGFQIIPNEIPGLGSFEVNAAKISMRVPSRLEGEIRAGRALGLHLLLPTATDRLGGFSDACHSLTAATTIPLGRERSLIEEMEAVLGGS